MLPEVTARQGSDLLFMVRSISEVLDLDEVTRRCLKYVVRLLAGQGGIITLRNENGEFYVANELGIDPQTRPTFDELLDQLVSYFGENSDLVTNNSEKTLIEQIVNQMAVSLSPNWIQTIPIALSFEQSLLGIIFVFRSYESEVTEFLGSALHTLTEQSAIAIHHATLFQNVKQERQRLAILVNHSTEGILLLNSDLCVESINPAIELMTGWTATSAKGKHHDEIIKWSEQETISLRKALQKGWPNSFEIEPTLFQEGQIIRRDGLPFFVGVSYAPILV